MLQEARKPFRNRASSRAKSVHRASGAQWGPAGPSGAQRVGTSEFVVNLCPLNVGNPGDPLVIYLLHSHGSHGPFIDGLPNNSMVIFHGYVSHNQMVTIICHH